MKIQKSSQKSHLTQRKMNSTYSFISKIMIFQSLYASKLKVFLPLLWQPVCKYSYIIKNYIIYLNLQCLFFSNILNIQIIFDHLIFQSQSPGILKQRRHNLYFQRDLISQWERDQVKIIKPNVRQNASILYLRHLRSTWALAGLPREGRFECQLHSEGRVSTGW